MALMTGWDAGRVSSTKALLSADGGSGLQEEKPDTLMMGAAESDVRQLSIDLQDARHRFEKFIRDFKQDNVFVYREQLRRNYTMQRYVLEVDLTHTMLFDEELANELKYFPMQLLPAFEDAAGQCSLLMHSWRGADAELTEEAQRAQLHPQVILRSSQQSLLIRDLYSAHIGRLVVVPGIVIGTSKTNAKATHLHLICRFCGDEQDVKANPGFQSTLLPTKCLNTGLVENDADEERDLGARVAANDVACGKPDAYRVVGDLCLYEDQQSLKLQEAPEDVPTGEMPRHLQLSAERYLVGLAAPGCRVLAVGVYSVNSVQDKHARGQATGAVGIQTSYLQLVGLQVDEEGSGRIGQTFNREEEQQCIELGRTPRIYEAISRSIAPAIYGHEDIKKAIACLLFGGSKKYLPDGMRIRGDINALLLGDPGTAKSQFLKFAEKVAPIGVYTSGKGSSAAGLTASVIRDAHSREFYLEGGAMVLADGGVVCIDEFDKMHTQDRVAIHEAMEQQTISIAKAGITTILNARTSVLAAANPIFGSYDDMRSPTENIEFQSTILSRFDMIFLVRDHRNPARDRTIAEHVMNVHMNVRQEPAEGELDIAVLKKYISYCRLKCSPVLTEGACAALKNHYVSIRSAVRNNNNRVRANGGSSSSAIPITVRQLEAIVRISEAVAKMSLSPYATEEHVAEAIRLFKVSTLEAALSGAVASESLSPEVMKEVSTAEALLKRRLPIGSRTSYQKLLKECELKHKLDRFAIQKAVSIMAQRNEVQFRNQRKMIVRTR